MNQELAQLTLLRLVQAGIRKVCVCPGARNAPLIAALNENKDIIESLYFYDERSAAFFALGEIMSSGNPVAVITTSGTAAGELLPATMEAFYSGLSLVLITADRPKRYRGTGAPQCAEQVGIFGVYVSECLDVETPQDLSHSLKILDRPYHLNLCFDEPLLEKNASYRISSSPKIQTDLEIGPDVTDCVSQVAKLKHFLTEIKNPLVIVGELQPEVRASVLRFLLSWGAPTYFEALSGLRDSSDADSIRLPLGEQVIERAYLKKYPVDGVLRIGRIPTLRSWRDLEDKFAHLPVCSISSLPFSGLSRNTLNLQVPMTLFFEQALSVISTPVRSATDFLSEEAQRLKNLYRVFETHPTSEPALMHFLARSFAPGSTVYLGNSLPIRHWDLAASRDEKRFRIGASRGLNGIDGQVSTFLGFARKNTPNWGIFGDLTALYDLSAPWILKQLKETPVQIIVVNNQGGKIFDRMFTQVEFQNQHQLSFKAWADLWGLEYLARASSLGHNLLLETFTSQKFTSHSHLIELKPENEATQKFWKEFQAL